MVEVGTIKSVTITDGECACEVDFGASVVETCVLYENVGGNNYPLPGDNVAVSMTDGQNTILAVSRAVPDDLKQGEHVIYSRNSSGELQANIKLTDDGEINLNEGDDFAVKFNELKSAFDELKGELDALVTVYNAHIHVTSNAVVGSPVTVVPTTSTGTPPAADMSSAKVEKVKL